MKKTKFKGFTLIECLVALAILGIATMTMAQIYANVARINQTNHLVNTSLSYQMKYVEEKTASEAVPMLYGNSTAKDPQKTPPHKNAVDEKAENKTSNVTANGNFFKITSSLDSSIYSCGVDIYVLMSRDADDNDSSDAGYRGKNENAYNLRYRYIVGHSN